MKKLFFITALLVLISTSAFSEFYQVPDGAIRMDGALTYGVPATPVGPAPGIRPTIYPGHLGPMSWMSYPMVPVPVNVAPSSDYSSSWEDK